MLLFYKVVNSSRKLSLISSHLFTTFLRSYQACSLANVAKFLIEKLAKVQVFFCIAISIGEVALEKEKKIINIFYTPPILLVGMKRLIHYACKYSPSFYFILFTQKSPSINISIIGRFLVVMLVAFCDVTYITSW